MADPADAETRAARRLGLGLTTVLIAALWLFHQATPGRTTAVLTVISAVLAGWWAVSLSRLAGRRRGPARWGLVIGTAGAGLAAAWLVWAAVSG